MGAPIVFRLNDDFPYKAWRGILVELCPEHPSELPEGTVWVTGYDTELAPNASDGVGPTGPWVRAVDPAHLTAV